MPRLTAEAIVCAIRPHGEHDAICRLLTQDHGLIAGYVRGGRSTRLRPIFLAGNHVKAEFRLRSEGMPGLDAELLHSRGPLMAEPLPAAAIGWVSALTAVSLPERNAYPALYQALEGVLLAIEGAPAAKGWAVALVRYELLLLSELGYGLSLNECVVTGSRNDLTHVSPKSAKAVSREAASGIEHRLLTLPPFLLAGHQPDWEEIISGLKLTGFFLERSILSDWRGEILAGRDRLLDRLKRAVA